MQTQSHKKKALILSFLLGFFVFTAPTLVYAKKTINDAQGFLGKTVQPTGVSTQDLSSQVGTIIQGALRLVGIVFLILMVYGGFRWMTARGNEAEIEKAKETVTAAIIGLIVVVGAYALTNFITTRFIQGQTGDGGSIGSEVNEPPNAAQGCCEFKINEIPTWTAFMMTEASCEASCKNALGKDCDSGDWKWDPTANQAQCEERRQDALR